MLYDIILLKPSMFFYVSHDCVKVCDCYIQYYTIALTLSSNRKK